MPPRPAYAALMARLLSIRDVVHDLQLELDRPDSHKRAGLRAMVAHIQHQTNAALRLLEKNRLATPR